MASMPPSKLSQEMTNVYSQNAKTRNMSRVVNTSCKVIAKGFVGTVSQVAYTSGMAMVWGAAVSSKTIFSNFYFAFPLRILALVLTV